MLRAVLLLYTVLVLQEEATLWSETSETSSLVLVKNIKECSYIVHCSKGEKHKCAKLGDSLPSLPSVCPLHRRLLRNKNLSKKDKIMKHESNPWADVPLSNIWLFGCLFPKRSLGCSYHKTIWKTQLNLRRCLYLKIIWHKMTNCYFKLFSQVDIRFHQMCCNIVLLFPHFERLREETWALSDLKVQILCALELDE